MVHISSPTSHLDRGHRGFAGSSVALLFGGDPEATEDPANPLCPRSK